MVEELQLLNAEDVSPIEVNNLTIVWQVTPGSMRAPQKPFFFGLVTRESRFVGRRFACRHGIANPISTLTSDRREKIKNQRRI
jgi:hypothetical protein